MIRKLNSVSGKSSHFQSKLSPVPTSLPRHQSDFSKSASFPVVGMGASAGGLESLRQFFTYMPVDSGMAFVVILHSDPGQKSQLSELLQRVTSMHVYQAKNRMRVKPDCVYVAPPDKNLAISNGTIILLDFESPETRHLSIDFFFRALAEECHQSAIGVIFSGAGSDGKQGLQAIKQRNGLVFVQDPITSEFDSMPQSAIETGLVDAIAPVALLPERIIDCLKSETREKSFNSWEKIIEMLQQRTGSNFSQYKKSTLCRRIERRMMLNQLDKLDDYIDLLHRNPQELDLLFKDILINVTHFFRDPAVWQYLEKEIFPSILAAHPGGKVMRAWVPACSTGEEAYGLAMLFKEVMEKAGLSNQYSLKIFATDLDQDAIIKARQAFYPASIRKYVSSERLDRFFVAFKNGYQLCSEIREMVIFAPQNVITDIPFLNIDILSCRNLLIYLNQVLQERLLSLFHYALNPDGILLLGTAETIDGFPDLFFPLERKLRIYKRLPDDAKKSSKQTQIHGFLTASNQTRKELSLSIQGILHPPVDHLLKNYSVASVLIDEKGDILYISNHSGNYVKIEQNSRLDPLSEQMNGITLASLMSELQFAREEIQTTHEEMQTSQEELRSSNEELQSTNEELHSANRALQLANEALITSQEKQNLLYEELQITNAELMTYLEAIGQLALVSVSDRTGRIIKANDRFCEVSGYSRAELLGQDHRILNSGTHSRSFFVEMWATIAKGGIWHKEICNRNKNGALYWVDSTIVPLKNADGKVVQYVSIRVDITAHKQKELILRERLKERICLYAIRRDMERDLSIQELCHQIFKRLIPAMQFPDHAACAIELNNKQYASAQYNDDLANGIFAKIKVNGRVCGQLQVFYTENKTFMLPDEQNLVNYIADDLRLWLERKQAEQYISHMANHDVLTGLPNRLLLQDRLSQALAHNQRYHGKTAVLFIDLDHFKMINDSLGHGVGDLYLQEVAGRLFSSIRSEDTAARQGGDEFIVVLPHVIDLSDVEAVAQKILNTLGLPFLINEKELHISGSIGIALYPDDGQDVDTLLRLSDIAMYHAKALGRNNYKFFTPEMNRQTIEKHELVIDLRHAVRNDEFQLYYQPVIDHENDCITSMEVLLRWQHPTKGLIMPAQFIQLAEETGLIMPVGAWVIKSVCLQIKAWQEQGYDVPRLAINISARQFQQRSFVQDMASILELTDVSAHCLALEITESMLVKNVEEVTDTLQALSAMGFKILIDDFGTGYSSLSYLKHYTIDTLKIDRSFVRDIATDENDAAIITAIIAMAHSLNMQVIAEGVETEEQISFLAKRGCRQYQGFYFSKPLPALEIEGRLSQH